MINVRIQHERVQKLSPKIIVVGVGGAGGNAVNNMINEGLQGVEFLVCNTDAQALENSLCEKKVQLGVSVTGGLGAGAKPETGRAAAEESLDDVMQYIEGANMAFITAGMGGGTGTGAAPVIAKACREKGVLTVGVVTKPFHFEGTYRMKMAEEGLREIQDYVDTLIVIPNQNLFRIANEKTTFAEAFRMADTVLQAGVRGVTDLMLRPGLINLDFADIRSVMQEMGKAMMGTGEAQGERRAIEAAEKAINNPLLDDVSMKGARGVIINVTGGLDMTLFEVDESCNRIRDEVDPNANIIFGSTYDEALDGTMRVSIVATGIESAEARARQPVQGAAAAAPQAREQMPSPAMQSPVGMTRPFAMRTPVPASRPLPSPLAASQAPVTSTQPATFEQQELSIEVSAAREYQVKKSEETVPGVPVAAVGQSLRGTIYNDSFIPPNPVEPEIPRSGESSYGLSLGGLSARRSAAPPVDGMGSAVAVATGGYTLRPPVPGAMTTAAQQQKKRSPSLFDRLTHPLRHHGEVEGDNHETAQGGNEQGSGSSSFGEGSLRASQRPAVQQGFLSVEAQATAPRLEATPLTDNELDIPAFLRRQAN